MLSPSRYATWFDYLDHAPPKETYVVQLQGHRSHPFDLSLRWFKFNFSINTTKKGSNFWPTFWPIFHDFPIYISFLNGKWSVTKSLIEIHIVTDHRSQTCHGLAFRRKNLTFDQIFSHKTIIFDRNWCSRSVLCQSVIKSAANCDREHIDRNFRSHKCLLSH